VAYDEAVISAESEQLLINIARTQHHEPIHFSQVSNIAATFDFRFNAGATPALIGDSGGMILPTFPGTAAGKVMTACRQKYCGYANDR
jgi:hypothetical protein